MPPVTPERSPPASRMTGADSPVMADSSTEATPSTISPSAGMTCPASTTTRSPARSAVEETTWPSCVAGPSSAEGRACPARVCAEAVGLGLAARLGQRLGEVGEQDRQEQPDVQRRSGSRSTPGRGRVEQPWRPCRRSVRTVPTSTTNITGFFHWMSGPQHDERLPQRGLQQVRGEQPLPAAEPAGHLELVGPGGRGLGLDGSHWLKPSWSGCGGVAPIPTGRNLANLGSLLRERSRSSRPGPRAAPISGGGARPPADTIGDLRTTTRLADPDPPVSRPGTDPRAPHAPRSPRRGE